MDGAKKDHIEWSNPDQKNKFHFLSMEVPRSKSSDVSAYNGITTENEKGSLSGMGKKWRAGQ